MDLAKIEKMIYLLRGTRVMLDSDLAELYGVETKRLSEQVKRNFERFPSDFMFICNSEDLQDLRSQIATAKLVSSLNFKRRTNPMVFTESGVAMLSSVLNSPQAIQVNISIIRIFVKLRSFVAFENTTDKRVGVLEKNTTKLFKVVFERLDDIEETLSPRLPGNRKKIGLKEE